jgi:hyperosmotically inducible periplasmic protein
MRRLKKVTFVMLLSLLAIPFTGIAGPTNLSPAVLEEERIMRAVRHELVMLPFYDVFDDLAYRVEGSTVTLSGYVTRPTLKTSAERVVLKVPGVQLVVNQIEVLPLSPMDERIRYAVFFAVYGNPALDRYSHQAIPPIRIVVKNGHVVLTGVVFNRLEKTLAEMKARGVGGVFSVTNNLRTEKT